MATPMATHVNQATKEEQNNQSESGKESVDHKEMKKVKESKREQHAHKSNELKASDELSMDRFRIGLLIYQLFTLRWFGADWGLRDETLRLFFQLLTRTSASPEPKPTISLFQFLFAFAWLGPVNLKSSTDIGPAPLVLTRIASENCSVDLSKAAPLCPNEKANFAFCTSRSAAEKAVHSATKFLIRGGEGKLDCGGFENGRPCVVLHARMGVSTVNNDSKDDKSWEHQMTHAYDPRTRQMVESDTQVKERYRRRGVHQTTSYANLVLRKLNCLQNAPKVQQTLKAMTPSVHIDQAFEWVEKVWLKRGNKPPAFLEPFDRNWKSYVSDFTTPIGWITSENDVQTAIQHMRHHGMLLVKSTSPAVAGLAFTDNLNEGYIAAIVAEAIGVWNFSQQLSNEDVAKAVAPPASL